MHPSLPLSIFVFFPFTLFLSACLSLSISPSFSLFLSACLSLCRAVYLSVSFFLCLLLCLTLSVSHYLSDSPPSFSLSLSHYLSIPLFFFLTQIELLGNPCALMAAYVTFFVRVYFGMNHHNKKITGLHDLNKKIVAKHQRSFSKIFLYLSSCSLSLYLSFLSIF